MTDRPTRQAEQTPVVSNEALVALWRERGPQALATVREYDPSTYIRLLAYVMRDGD